MEPGDVWIASNASVILPELENKHLELLHQKARNYVCRKLGRQPKTQTETVRMFTKYVHAVIKYDDSWFCETRGNRAIRLEEAINRRAGICKEQTLILYMLLRREGIDACPIGLISNIKSQRRGLAGHMAVRVRIGDKKYIADPSQNEIRAEDVAMRKIKKDYFPRITHLIRAKRD